MRGAGATMRAAIDHEGPCDHEGGYRPIAFSALRGARLEVEHEFTPSIRTFHSRLEVEDEALELQHEQLRQPLEARAHVDLL